MYVIYFIEEKKDYNIEKKKLTYKKKKITILIKAT